VSDLISVLGVVVAACVFGFIPTLNLQVWNWSYSGAVVDDAPSKADEGQDRPHAAPEQEHGFGDLQSYVPQDILHISFPVSVRGYDRRAVDAFTQRVNRAIAELNVRASPPAAVRHALEQAEEKVQGLLKAAREAAEEITASAQREAEESTARAKAEAAELVVNTSAEADRVKAEADELIANARTEADDTVAKTKADADEMIADARAKAQDTLARRRPRRTSAFSVCGKSWRPCARRPRPGCARSRLIPRRSGTNAASCSKTSAGWPAA
jgi:DivIVA domain-containing protein